MTALGGMEVENRGINFEDRIKNADEDTFALYTLIKEHLLSYQGIKNRLSIRCDSYRCCRRLIAKMAIGGSSLKIFLPREVMEEEQYSQIKIRFRDLSDTSAYEETPAMVPVKSVVGARKICKIIDIFMERNEIKQSK
ncbi:MAG: hypothetical protein HFE33_03700 [Clostridia bacterium]|nr:hypothetical protein [Clostridia bacterium]